ncbi:Ankyrin repeat-containing domain protein [Metarhizium guizhouense ARSEF 977]|uniref:Ankyrin repeat-containing domain protein n=1 Tax=Metarhizium guizhouense (strain ARSEF 977) TaxID=1276136 RepID=A0A0B4GI42_METGA|nr:Ankyrin repeat-containing domain protein [Metarhizium guizhouense ARSEF 977]
MYGTRLPYRVTEADRKQFRIADPALTTKTKREVFDLVHANKQDFSIALLILVQAIDLLTGDSLLHVAVRAQSMNSVIHLMEGFDRTNNPRNPFDHWSRHAFIAHQNRDGDTVFHVAARSGNLKLMIMLYRFINNHWSALDPDMEDEESPENDKFPKTVDEGYSSSRLMLLITKNRAGRGAAAEARFVGNYEISGWLDAVANRLDPEGSRRTGQGISDMVDIVMEGFCYDLMIERKQRETQEKLLTSFSYLRV